MTTWELRFNLSANEYDFSPVLKDRGVKRSQV
jgi:hypothetical protein